MIAGDSGYALRPWMQTPILDPEPGTPEEYFSRRLTSIRSVIERVNGIAKMRFRCIIQHRALHYTPEKAAKIVKACCVLHNMCIEDKLPNPDFPAHEIRDAIGPDAIPEFRLPNRREDPDLYAGRRFQDELCHRLWNARNRNEN